MRAQRAKLPARRDEDTLAQAEAFKADGLGNGQRIKIPHPLFFVPARQKLAGTKHNGWGQVHFFAKPAPRLYCSVLVPALLASRVDEPPVARMSRQSNTALSQPVPLPRRR